MTQCTDRVIGKILAGWRYDISGIAPEMRGDYEAHLAECEFCRSRQRLHRGIDIGLMALASISMFVFLLAYGVIRHFKPSHAFLLEIGALGGFLLSMLLWLLVAVATPAPLVMKDAAMIGARRGLEKLPEEIRDRIPEDLKLKIFRAELAVASQQASCVVSEAALERLLDEVREFGRRLGARYIRPRFDQLEGQSRVSTFSGGRPGGAVAVGASLGRCRHFRNTRPRSAILLAAFHQTFRVMFTMAFGSLEQALAASRRLQRRHSSIRGKLPEAVGQFRRGVILTKRTRLTALRWVYATLVDSSVVAYELVLPPLTAPEREQYYEESKILAMLFGISRDCLPVRWPDFKTDFEATCESSLLAVSPATRDMAQQLQRGAGSWLRPPFWYRALTTSLLPRRLREEFELPYGKSEELSASRAMRWLPRIYGRLPGSIRFVGPYQEAQAKLRGKSHPGLTVRLSNRVWVGEATLLSFDKTADKLRRTEGAFEDKMAP